MIKNKSQTHIIGAIFVFVLMLIASASSEFIFEKDIIKSKKDILTETGDNPPAAYVYTDDFEDDTIASCSDTNPLEDWYNHTQNAAWGKAQDYSHVDIYDTGSTQVYRIAGHGSDTEINSFMLNSTSGFNLTFFNISFYRPSAADTKFAFNFINDADSDSGDYKDVLAVMIGSDNDNLELYDGDSYTVIGAISEDTWHWFNCSFDHANDQVDFYSDIGNELNYGLRQSGTDDNIQYICFNVVKVNIGTIYLDNLTIGSPVLLEGETPEEPEDPSEFGIFASYLNNNNITFSGTSGETSYSNESVSTGKNVTIYTSVNTSENCTDIYIDLSGDTTFGDSDEVNFSTGGGSTMYLQVSTNSTWDGSTWVEFNSTNGYNISLNNEWENLSDDDANPFTIRNASGNITIICRFKLVIGEGINQGEYATDNNTIWEISHKYETTW